MCRGVLTKVVRGDVDLNSDRCVCVCVCMCVWRCAHKSGQW